MHRTQVDRSELHVWRFFLVAVWLAGSAGHLLGQERASWDETFLADNRATLQEQADRAVQSARVTDRTVVIGIAWAAVSGAVWYFLWREESIFSHAEFTALGAGTGLVIGLLSGRETGERTRDRRPRWRQVGTDIWADVKLYTKPEGMYVGEVVCDRTASDGTGLVRIRLPSGEVTSALRTTVSAWYVERSDPALEAARWCNS